jgi:hypothetical protein
MSDLPSKLEVPVWGGIDRILTFERAEDVVGWAEREASSWPPDCVIRTNALKQQWTQQHSSFLNIANQARQLDGWLKSPEEPGHVQQVSQTFQSLQNRMRSVSQGTLLTSDHPNFGYITEIAKKDGDAAAVLMLASRSDGAGTLQNAGPPLDAIARLGVEFVDGSKQGEAIAAHRKALASLKSSTEKELTALRETLAGEQRRSKQIEEDHSERVRVSNEQWSALLKKSDDDWEDLKRVYDEKLSLLAPTEYWNGRAEHYKRQAIWYAIAFGVALCVMIGLFAWFGIGELKTTKATSVLVAILPVIIPAFAGVWVLRILGRQLSESLMIMKDAEERETLVKTFLALMRDETTGKAVINEADRVLILQALFRQSRVTAVDDSPPLNSAEAVLKSVGR